MLTAKQIEALRPREKSYRVADSRGLSLRVDPSGARYWIATIGRKTRSLGRWPDVSAVEARRRLFEAGAERERAKANTTFQALAEQWHTRKGSELSSGKYHAQILARLQSDVFPAIGARDLSELRRRDLAAIVESVAARGAVETAHRLAQYIVRILDYAVDLGWIESHPGAGLVRILPAKHAGHHAAVPTDQAGEVFRALWGYSAGGIVVAAALRLAALTVLRSSELAGLRWSEVRDDALVIPAERMKRRLPHVVPLSSQAMAELNRLRPVSGGGEHVLPGKRGPHLHPETVRMTLVRLGFAGRQTAHGLRAIFSTVANESGLWSRDAIERQLAHKETDAVRAAYHRAEYLDDRRRLMQWWGDWIDARCRV